MTEDPPTNQYVVTLCDPCISGEGECCWTPGCALFMHHVDIPIIKELLTKVSYNQEKNVYEEVQE